MESIIRKLTHDDLGDFWEIVVLAGSEGYYPERKVGRVGWFRKIMDECRGFTYYGAFRNDTLAGGMAVGDFKLNLRSSIVNLSGVGMVHTDMLHKKEKICKDMMKYFIDMNRDKGVNILFLSPFRPDFYKSMGFGYGSNLYNFHIPPQSFPHSGSKENLSYVGDNDKQAFLDCFHRVFDKTHGAIDRNPFWLIETFGSGRRILVYKAEGQILGFLVFSFGDDKEMIIEEFVYENSVVLMSLCTFLYSQSDQFDRINFSTPDEDFYYLLRDPLDGLHKLESCTVKIDNMFRVINVKGLFAELRDTDFNGQSGRLDITVNDSFYPQNSGTTSVSFRNGRVEVLENNENDDTVAISLDISDFSSLLMGAVGIKTLCRLGLCQISDEKQIDFVDKVFMTGHKPLGTVHI